VDIQRPSGLTRAERRPARGHGVDPAAVEAGVKHPREAEITMMRPDR